MFSSTFFILPQITQISQIMAARSNLGHLCNLWPILTCETLCLFDYDSGPTVLVLDLAILDTAQGVEELL